MLNQDLAKICTWADKWLVTFNTQKTESLQISRKINKQIHPPIVMNNDDITEVDNHKHLGVVFENTCTWHLPINMIISKAWQRIYTMRKLKFLLDRQSLQAIYISFISKSRKENPQKLTPLSSRSHPRHLVGKRTAQKDTIIDITSDSQVNSNFPNRWSPASLAFYNYFYLFLY